MIDQKKSGVIISYISQAVHIITSLIYVPIMLRILGKSEYGLYQLVASVIGYLSILSLGFNTSYIRFYSRYKVKEDLEGIKKLNGMFLIIFSILSAICLACGIFMVFNARFIFGSKLLPSELETAKILMILLVISMSVSFLSSMFQSQISAHSHFLWLKMVELISNILNPIITLPILLLGFGSIGVVSVTVLITISVCIFNFIYAYKKLNVRFLFRKFDLILFKEMSGFTFYIFMNIVIEQINWSVDKYLLGRMRGTESVAVYGVASQLVTLYRTITSTIRGVFIPQINEIIAKDLKDRSRSITELFTKLGRVIFFLTFLILSGFILFGHSFITLWAGDGYENAYYVALIMMIPLIVPIIQGPGLDIQRAMNLHKARSIVYTLIAIVNILLSIVLIGPYGEIGAAIGTSISLFLGNILFMNIYYHKRIGIDMFYFWKQIGQYLPSAVIIIGIGVVLKILLKANTLISMGACIIIYSIIYFTVFFLLGFNKYEKDIFVQPMKKIIRKLKIK